MPAHARQSDFEPPSQLQLKVSRDIVDYIQRGGLKAGAHLKEQKLADYFQVSRTPIRGALNYLAERNVVEQRQNRGFFVTTMAETLELSALDFPQTALEQLYNRVGQDWFEGHIEEQFSELDFCRHYDVGRLTASRVLLKLSEDGVISRSAGYGWRFEPTLNTQEAHDESYSFRIVMEPAAIRLATFRLDQRLADIVRRRHETVLSADVNTKSISNVFNMDAEFHRMIGQCCGNRFFLSVIERQNNLRRLVEYASLLDTGRLAASCSEHLNILDCLETGAQDKAADLMAEHLTTASDFGPRFWHRQVISPKA